MTNQQTYKELPDTITPFDYAEWRGIGENKAREKLTIEILKDFKDRITGKKEEIISNLSEIYSTCSRLEEVE